MHRTLLRPLQAAILAIGVSIIPLATVSACSCMAQDFHDAIATADAAIVGTVASIEDAGSADLGEAVLTTWSVSASRDPNDAAHLGIRSVDDNGANCGVSFGADERWLVFASRGELGLETNGCMMNRRLDGSDPEVEALIAEAMTPVTATAAPVEPGPSVPTPIIGLGVAVGLIGLVSLLAFRRRSAS